MDCDSNSRKGNLGNYRAVTVAANFKGGNILPQYKEIDDDYNPKHPTNGAAW